MLDFAPFGNAVAEKVKLMSKGELFRAGDKDKLWEVYLGAFPEGTNPIVVTRTEHDCSCCRGFVKNMGNVVSIKGSDIDTVWDVEGLEYPYDIVAKACADYLRESAVQGLFRASEKNFGAKVTRASNPNGGAVITWNHFFGSVDNKHYTSQVATVLGEANAKHQVARRGLEEISSSAVDTVLDLIKEKSIYRGEEFKKAVDGFKTLQIAYRKTNKKDLFVWENIDKFGALIRNTVIGSLLTDISDGVDLNRAVASFESKVAPSNYKRPKPVVTQKMLDMAFETLEKEDLGTALERRHATIRDVAINDVLFADRNVKPVMKNSLDVLKASVSTSVISKKVKPTSAIETISVDKFLSEILPEIDTLELQVESQHSANFVTVTAPVHDGVKPIFKWDNNFAWSYDGNVTDSEIKTKVARAGGNVSAPFRVSLSWFNYDDLDIHCQDPFGNKIYFGNRMGILDVDMNVGATTREAVENLSWVKYADGDYKIEIKNFTRREMIDLGFTLEVECQGEVRQYNYRQSVGQVQALTISIKNGLIDKIVTHKDVELGFAAGREKWGIKLDNFVPVSTVMLSPNYWGDNETGNRHLFFMLKDCINPDPVRGIYNEYLRGDLDKHRKVFELLGMRTMIEPTEEQLSGVGFSSTKETSVLIRVDGKRSYIIKF